MGILEITLPPLPASPKTWLKRLIGKDKLKMTPTGMMFKSDIDVWRKVFDESKKEISPVVITSIEITKDDGTCDNRGITFRAPNGCTLMLVKASDLEKETWAACDGWIKAYMSCHCKVMFDDNQGTVFSMPAGYTLVLASDSVIEKIYGSQNRQEVKLYLPDDGKAMLECYIEAWQKTFRRL